ncbi:ferric reductase-like transmembrane domain-containing protein [Paracoccus sp. 1_MG-2023]|nr:ferric reductase-like transmembrane domain-containing protein [Paracoccus sp. 1_MG-2023]MBU2957907.1 ferric reductase-like transmembrane domain-containing protein [Paracoccus sp. C2R09]MDO6668900.1 ferric reductase-like transmembrane domain-containing protein [Paracoccus sp. 1_MG-2023]
MIAPIVAAAFSPLLTWRGPVYQMAGFAGIAALALMLPQPLLTAAPRILGIDPARGRRMHRLVGPALVAAVLLHVAGLWVTSPPDVIDVLLFRSPTPFSLWGMIGLCAILAAAVLTPRLRVATLRIRRMIHRGLTLFAAPSAVAHTILIEGTMEPVTKIALSIAVIAATALTLRPLR